VPLRILKPEPALMTSAKADIASLRQAASPQVDVTSSVDEWKAGDQSISDK
jgi:hypothetical protein